MTEVAVFDRPQQIRNRIGILSRKLIIEKHRLDRLEGFSNEWDVTQFKDIRALADEMSSCMTEMSNLSEMLSHAAALISK